MDSPNAVGKTWDGPVVAAKDKQICWDFSQDVFRQDQEGTRLVEVARHELLAASGMR